MARRGNSALTRSVAHVLFGISVAAAAGAQATPYELIYTGAFNSQEALNPSSAPSPTYFSGSTPFTIRAQFDDASTNLAPTFGGPFSGFRAYAPSSATIDIAGTRYSIESILANPLAGVTVAIFDKNSFFPGRYGVGLIADPVNDGAGIVGDFSAAAPEFTVNALLPVVFTEYYGVGHGSGVCVSGTPPACPHAVTPWVLRDSGNVAWSLTLGSFEEDYPVAHTPGATVGPLNTAQIITAPMAVPEPPAYAVMFIGLASLLWMTRRGGRTG